ncbi:hypothetical protein SLS62_006142 [Diatrype stigma]|uniref:Uncharacterized protein n=1 Tax=Diatrype stigma TaxID=117547 RepID=A0AAN9UPV6_9PEZI
MASTTNSASTRVYNGTRGSTRPSRAQHLPARWEEPAALAHGSPSPYYGRPGAKTARGPNPTAVYRDMERGPALAPELDNSRDAASMMRSNRRAAEEQPPKRSGGGGLMRRMFERRDDSGKPPSATTTRPRISAPSAPQKAEKVMMPPGFAYTVPAGATSSGNGNTLKARGPPPPRPTRPPVELSPAPPLAEVPLVPSSSNGIPPELAALKTAAMAARVQAATPVVIRPERLGTAAEALRSNPVHAPGLLQARKVYNRQTSVVGGGGSGGDGVVEMHPGRNVQRDRETLELPVSPEGGRDDDDDNDVVVASTKASRRCGMIFDTASLSLTSFPEPVFSPEVTAADSDDDHHQRQQQSEGEDEVEPNPKAKADAAAVADEVLVQPAQQPLQKGGAAPVPAVVLTPPWEPARQTVDHLTADYPYKRQLRRERAEMRAAMARWEPVGEMLCEASGGAVDDPADAAALAGVLGRLADDSARYCALRPTLDLLARDRRVSAEDPDALARGIVDVLNVRNEAVVAAAHHKKKARALERKLEALAGAGSWAGAAQ